MTRDLPARALAVLTAFLLPLGTIGIGGVVALGLYLVTFGRRVLPGEGRLVAAALPLALALPAATLAFAREAGAAPTRTALVHALGMAAIVLIGPVALRRMVARAGAGLLAAAFVAGAVGLAASVIADAALGWQRIPVGLYRVGDLHNVTAAVLVVAFAPALRFATHGRARFVGAAAALTLAVGVLAAWSWVGALGLAAGALAFVALHRGWEAAALTLPGAVALSLVAYWSAAHGGWYVPGLETLGEILSSRARIFAQGLELAAQRPWGGWGSHMGDLAGPLGGVGRYHVDDLVLPHFHSLTVQTAFETGVPGLMALAVWFGYLLLAARGPWRAAAGAALVGFLATQAFDLAWHHASVMVSVTLAAALGLAPEPVPEGHRGEEAAEGDRAEEVPPAPADATPAGEAAA